MNFHRIFLFQYEFVVRVECSPCWNMRFFVPLKETFNRSAIIAATHSQDCGLRREFLGTLWFFAFFFNWLDVTVMKSWLEDLWRCQPKKSYMNDSSTIDKIMAVLKRTYISHWLSINRLTAYNVDVDHDENWNIHSDWRKLFLNRFFSIPVHRLNYCNNFACSPFSLPSEC